MRAGTASTIVAALLAGGLTAWGNPSVEPLWRKQAERVEAALAGWTGGVTAVLEQHFGEAEEIHPPGPTCALVVSEAMIVGVDADGYVTCRESSYEGDLAALTGFKVSPDSVGEHLERPELALGLSIVRAFDRAAGLSEMLSEVYLGDLGNPRVILSGGVTVEFGGGDYTDKIARLHQILLQAPELGIRPVKVDMRFGPQVVVEFEKTKEQPRKEV